MAYVESGNTASRTYVAGDFISWKGTLYTARTAIPLGDSFAVDTNLSAVTSGGLNKLKEISRYYFQTLTVSFDSMSGGSGSSKTVVIPSVTGKTPVLAVPMGTNHRDMIITECTPSFGSMTIAVSVYNLWSSAQGGNAFIRFMYENN